MLVYLNISEAYFLRTNLLQRDNFIFLPKDEQRRTLQLIPVLSFTDDPCAVSHKPMVKPQHYYYNEISTQKNRR